MLTSKFIWITLWLKKFRFLIAAKFKDYKSYAFWFGGKKRPGLEDLYPIIKACDDKTFDRILHIKPKLAVLAAVASENELFSLIITPLSWKFVVKFEIPFNSCDNSMLLSQYQSLLMNEPLVHKSDAN